MTYVTPEPVWSGLLTFGRANRAVGSFGAGSMDYTSMYAAAGAGGPLRSFGGGSADFNLQVSVPFNPSF